jgi:tetratricopeptide (TPR) repeat protein
MYPKNDRNSYFEVGPLVNEDPEEKIQDGYQNGVLQRDWLVFKVSSLPPGIHPLSIREKAINPGEKVYLTGNPYRFDQTIGLQGNMVKQEGNLLLVELEVPDSVFLGGASGSPLLDRNGHLIGIFSNTRTDPVSGKKSYLINSTNYLKDILNKKTPLNQNLLSVSGIMDSLVVNFSVPKALAELKRLYEDPQAYYIVNLSWPDYDALKSIGEKLLALQQIKEAIIYFKGLLKQYPGNHFFILSLAKTYQNSGDVNKAKHLLTEALKNADEFIKEEYIKMLKEIEKC